MANTVRHGLTLMAAAQAHKEITHNEALIRVDALLHAAIASDSVVVPPANPANGVMWLVPAGGTGAWAQHSGQIALWEAGTWTFIVPIAGLVVWNAATNAQIVFDGLSWKTEAWPVKSLEVGGETVVRGRRAAIADPTGGTVIDAQARSAITSVLGALRDHGLIAR